MNVHVPAWRQTTARLLTVLFLGTPLVGICGHCFAAAMETVPASVNGTAGNCHDTGNTVPQKHSHGSMPEDQCPCAATAASGPEVLHGLGPISSAGDPPATIPAGAFDDLEFSGTTGSAYPDPANRSFVSPVELYCARLE